MYFAAVGQITDTLLSLVLMAFLVLSIAHPTGKLRMGRVIGTHAD
jgi:hypothetical protein